MEMELGVVSQKLKSILLLAFTFFSCFAASGILPIISSRLQDSQVNNTIGFLPYFLSMLIGQMLIVFSPKIRHFRFSLLFVIISFAVSVFTLQFIFENYSGTEFLISLTTIRVWEGLTIGIGLPLVFEHVLKSSLGKTIDFRLILLNIASLAGFVLGVPSAEAWSISQISFLNFCGMILTVIAIAYFFFVQKRKDFSVKLVIAEKTLKITNWFSGFYLTFVAKLFYGYLISYVIFQKELFPISLFWLTLGLSMVSLTGQLQATWLTRHVSIKVLEVYVPLIFSFCLFLIVQKPSIFTLGFVVLLHSMVYFLGIRKAAYKPESAKEFAWINSLSDPGIVIGSALPLLSQSTSFSLICCFAAIPMILFLFQSYKRNRPESLHPYVGPFSLIKIFKKHKNPVITSDTDKFLNFKWNMEKIADSETIKILFAGDMIFHSQNACFADDDKNWIMSHDLRCLNLEAPIAEAPKGRFASQKLFSNFEDFTRFNETSKEPLFNLFSFLNNHSLDQGLKSYTDTVSKLRMGNYNVVDSNQHVVNIKGLRVGFLAKSFGLNLFWLHKKLGTGILNPDTLLESDHLKNILSHEIMKLRESADLVCLSYHWGYETESIPSATQTTLFDYFSSLGINIIYGHHTHVPQPVSLSADQKSLCLYSCGNLDVPMEHPVYNITTLTSVEISLSNQHVQKVETRFYYKTQTTYKRVKPPENDFVSTAYLNRIIQEVK